MLLVILTVCLDVYKRQALVCSITFFAACSSDDDDSKKNEGNEPEEEAVVTASDVVGTYWGNLNISMIADGSDQENVIADGAVSYTHLDVYKRQTID